MRTFCAVVRHPLVVWMLALINLSFIAEARAQASCPDLLVGLRSTIWKSLEIPVCWEAMNPQHEEGRRWSRQAVEDTWQKNSALRFVGWSQCTSSSRGIRIRVSDENPHVKGLGNQLDGRPDGMVLNFNFKAWSPTCSEFSKREMCIKFIAVHEFGHALGFSHEQNRADAPLWCQAEKQGTDGDIHITPYDPTSVMNYCANNWSGNGQLSTLDIQGLRSWYGQPARPHNRFDGRWTATLTYSDPGCVADEVDVTVAGNAVNGIMRTPDNRRVAVQASLDGEGRLQGFSMRLSPQDLITLKGVLTDGTVTSTDCGCGSYRFKRK